MGNSLGYKAPEDIALEERLGVLGLCAGDKPSIESVIKLISNGKVKNIIALCGAGISVAAGIPDFRTKGTGLYDNLQQYNLERPESMFDIEFFRTNPKPFLHLARELFPGRYSPTTTHYFLRLLEKKGLLLRVYTQNIDGLEYLAGLSEDKVIQCHGGFREAHCIDCNRKVDVGAVSRDIEEGKETHCDMCNGLCKPAITFFGENLPDRYHRHKFRDFARNDIECCVGPCRGRTIASKIPGGKRSFYCTRHLDLDPNAENYVEDTGSVPADAPEDKQPATSPPEPSEQEGTEVDSGEEPMNITCECDLLLVLGTSLSVAPVSGLVDDVHWLCPRVLLNNEEVRMFGQPREDSFPGMADGGFRFHEGDNYRDVALIDSCDQSVQFLAEQLDWGDELKTLINDGALSTAATVNSAGNKGSYEAADSSD